MYIATSSSDMHGRLSALFAVCLDARTTAKCLGGSSVFFMFLDIDRRNSPGIRPIIRRQVFISAKCLYRVLELPKCSYPQTFCLQ